MIETVKNVVKILYYIRIIVRVQFIIIQAIMPQLTAGQALEIFRLMDEMQEIAANGD